MLITNILEEHCHHTQDCIFCISFYRINRTRTDNEREKKKEIETEIINAVEQSKYIVAPIQATKDIT